MQIVSDFPKPPQDPTATAEADTTPRPQKAISSQESHTTDKENAPPATPPRPAIPAFAAAGSQDLKLPADVTNFYSTIRATLSKNFAKQPPHTVQRLAELVLEPKKRYKYLPPYLRALDRVVSVSSPLSLFPLPLAVLPTSGGMLNGTSAINTTTPTLGSDESLGGALLTPIPWLQNRGQNELVSESTEIVDGPNGAGRIETVTVGMLQGRQRPDAAANTASSSTPGSIAQIASSHPDGETLPATGAVTQGELLRQEQEAGIVLNNPHSMTTSPTRTNYGQSDGGATILDTVEGEDEPPHARGPETIGMEDTGPQKQAHALDIEGAVGRPSVDRASKSPGPVGEEAKDAEMNDGGEKSEDDKAGEKEGKDDKSEGKAEASEDVEMKSAD